MATEARVLWAPLARFGGVQAPARPMGIRECVDLCGAQIDMIDLETASARLRSFLLSDRFHQIVTVNLDFLRIGSKNPSFLRTINDADLAVADGMPLVWASSLKGQRIPERVTGVELVDEACRLAAEMNRSVFLLGAAPGVAEAAAAELQRRYPGLQIAGTYSPSYGPISLEEDAEIVRRIREAKPGVLLVALGAPRQDLWINVHRHVLNVPVTMGVGCTLDLLAGNLSRAPRWMQQSGLEWAFRMAQEPRRLWRRYILDDLPMFAELVADSLRGERQVPVSLQAYKQRA